VSDNVFNISVSYPKGFVLSKEDSDGAPHFGKSPQQIRTIARRTGQVVAPGATEEGSITVLNIGRMNDDTQQETQRIDQDVPRGAQRRVAV
jgi:hypothetical protein